MRLLLTLFVSCLAFSAQSQTDWTEVIKADNIRNLVGHMQGANINTCLDVNGVDYHPLSLAIKYDSSVLIDEISHGRDIDFSTVCSDKTILMYAVKYGDLQLVKSLIKLGAKVDQKSSQGRTTLDYARKYEKREIYEYLNSL